MSLRHKILATAAVLGLLACALASVVHSSFSSTVKTGENTFRAGSISLTSGQSEHVLFDLEGLEPDSPVAERCIEVSYASTGGLVSHVRLYGEGSGALTEHLDVRVTAGHFGGPAPAVPGSCDGFSAREPIYEGRLDGFPQDSDNALPDPVWEWRDGRSAVYRIQVSLADTDEAQGKSATQTFAFEARTA